AIIPGILYYLGVLTVVHLRAKRRGLRGLNRSELPSIKNVMKERGHLLIPLVILIYMLFVGYTPIYAAALAIISTAVISMLRTSTRINLKGLIQVLEHGTRCVLGVGISYAVVKIMVGLASLTVFALKMTSAFLFLGNDVLLFTLFFTMIASITLG